MTNGNGVPIPQLRNRKNSSNGVVVVPIIKETEN